MQCRYYELVKNHAINHVVPKNKAVAVPLHISDNNVQIPKCTKASLGSPLCNKCLRAARVLFCDTAQKRKILLTCCLLERNFQVAHFATSLRYCCMWSC